MHWKIYFTILVPQILFFAPQNTLLCENKLASLNVFEENLCEFQKINKRPQGHEGQLNTIRDSVQPKEPEIPYWHYEIQVKTRKTTDNTPWHKQSRAESSKLC